MSRQIERQVPYEREKFAKVPECRYLHARTSYGTKMNTENLRQIYLRCIIIVGIERKSEGSLRKNFPL